MVIKIREYSVVIDDDDYARISSLSWYPSIRPGRTTVYFRHSVSSKKKIWLHRFILNIDSEEKRLVDHISGDTFDNRKCNLRLCNNRENTRHTGKRITNKSGYKGVYKDKNKWRSCIRVNEKTMNLGTFSSPELAYAEYCKAALQYFGEYAGL